MKKADVTKKTIKNIQPHEETKDTGETRMDKKGCPLRDLCVLS